MQIGRLELVPLRELWHHEAHDFTTWLAQNLDLLGEKLGLELSLVQQEASAGPFSADIMAEDGNGSPAIIENQLERTNHDHLGKLITYLSNLDAKTAIWITSEPRPEHEQAVHWLNEVVPADTAFYLVRVEAYRIGDSAAAPLFTVVAGPSPEARQIGEQKEEVAERHILRKAFWTQLLAKAKEKSSLHARITPTTDNWIAAGSGKSGLSYNYVIRMEDVQVELYIDRGDTEENKRIFDELYAHKAEIESAFGGSLDWQRKDNLQASRIRCLIPSGGLRNQEQWPKIQEHMTDAMVRLERALKPETQRLK
jgi:hypothetical protein